ncbi:MAG: tRNA (guanosine(37)-N1)-methyltransferase TrmD, partial [Planctomycetes bacterium RBG_16_64_10]
VECVEAVQRQAAPRGHLVLLDPRGRRLTQAVVEELIRHPRLILVCGRYEGVDQRVIDILQPDPISVGDYILSGGEVAAMVVIDATVRLLPGVLGDATSNQQDSFSNPERLLEHAQYTRPRQYRGYPVPDVLLSGNHQEITRWRKQQSLDRTRARRGQRH